MSPFRPTSYAACSQRFHCHSDILAFRRSLSPFIRPYSTPTPTPPSSSQRLSRIDRLLKHTPAFLHPWITPIFRAPVSHITAFLLLHEITAVVPLFGLAATFHYTNWLPPWFTEGKVIVGTTERIGRYARRKGWISEEDEGAAERVVESGRGESVEKQKDGKLTWRESARTTFWKKEQDGNGDMEDGLPKRKSWWFRGWRGFAKGEEAVRWLVEFGTAYAIVKVLLPVRIVASAWATPWFARWTVVPVGRWGTRALGFGKTKVKNGKGNSGR